MIRYLLFITILLFSFKLQAQKGRKLYQDPDVIVFDVDTVKNKKKSEPVIEKKDSIIPVINKEKIEAKNNDYKNDKGKDTVIRKEVYEVALILPFSADAGWGSMAAGIKEMTENGVKKWTIPKETKISIDFYNGMKLAISKLNDANVKINLHVYDDKKNEDVIKEILKDSTLKEMDIIIGPAHTQNAKIVAEFCKENEIYNFSPLSTSKFIAISNPYHFKLSPTLDMHLKAMVDRFVTQYNSGSILLLCRPVDDERAYAASVIDYVAFLNRTRGKNEQLFCDTLIAGNENNKKIISSFYTGSHTYILIPSFNENFINTALDRSGGNSSTIDIFGFPSWTEYENVNYNSMNSKEPCFTKISFADTSKSEVKIFDKNFKDVHGCHPDENSFLGYDVMMFTAYALENYGLSLKENFEKLDYQGLATKFHFVPVKYSKFETGAELDMYENNQLNFLKFQNFDLVPLEIK